MLNKDDQLLCAREAHLPALPLLLDDAALTARLQRHAPQAQIRSVQAYYLRYKPATALLAAYRVVSASGTHYLSARHVAPPLISKLRHAQTFASQASWLGRGALLWPDERLALVAWPYDRHLPTLPRLIQPGDTLLRYKPARRAVIRRTNADVPELLKVFETGEFARVQQVYRALPSAKTLLLPHASDSHNACLRFPWRIGQALVSFDQGSLVQIAQALAALHREAAAALPREEPLVALQEALRAVVSLAPTMRKRAERLATRLAPWLRQPPEYCLIHGDANPEQLLICADQIQWLDLDNAAWGDPFSDLGSFCAYLACQEQNTAFAVYQGLSEAYAAAANRHDPARFAAHTAAWLVRRADEPFRQRQPNWLAQLEARLAAAERFAPHKDYAHR